MNIGTILGVTGIIVSVGFGIWGIFLALKRRYPGAITFIKEQSIGLFDAIAKDLPELSIKYKNSPVSQNLVLLKGALLNSGKLDISPSTIEKPLTVKLPKDYLWLEANIVDTSNNVNASIAINSGNELHIDIGLFRCAEFIRFQALAEVPVKNKDKNLGHSELGNNLESAMKFMHRIANTGKVTRAKVEEVDRKKTIRRIIIPTIVGIIGAISIASLFYFKGIDGKLVYSYELSENEYTDVTIRPKSDGMLKVKGVDIKVDEILKSEQFFKRVKGFPTVTENTSEYYLLIFTFLYFLLLPLMISIPAYLNYRRNQTLIKTLEIEHKKTNKRMKLTT